MIDSLINRMPHGPNTQGLGPTAGGRGKRRHSSVPRANESGKDVPTPHCKKRKKTHKWKKKARPRKRKVLLTKAKCKAKKGIRAKPEAPFNSTQFIMEEHNSLNDSDLSTSRPRRHRDSSLSMESEDCLEDEVYYSPEDQEKEFLTRQFWCAYEDYHAERLDAMSKSQLVQEYFALEGRLTLMERELKAAQAQDRRRIREPSPVEGEEEEESVPGEVPVDPETAAKIEIFRAEIQKLDEENERLRQENGLLRRGRSCRRHSDDNSSSSSSSSDSSSSHSDQGEDPAAAGEGGVAPRVLSPSACLVGEERVGSDEEFELSEATLKITDGTSCCYGPDSGIASSGEDVRLEEDAKLLQEKAEGLPSSVTSSVSEVIQKR